MKILKGYVFRMYPNENQEELINKTIGCSRFVYNYFLDDKIKEYKKTGKSKSAYDQIKLIPSLSKEKPWLKEVDSCALRNSLFNLEDAYKRFFNGNGYPRFKAKGVHESYKTNNIKSSYKGNNYNSIKLDLKNKTITLPKLKEVKIRGYRNKEVIPGEVKSAVIKKDAGKYNMFGLFCLSPNSSNSNNVFNVNNNGNVNNNNANNTNNAVRPLNSLKHYGL